MPQLNIVLDTNALLRTRFRAARRLRLFSNKLKENAFELCITNENKFKKIKFPNFISWKLKLRNKN